MNKEQILSDVFNEDCLDGMKRYPDNYFSLAIVDPPYGIGLSSNPVRQRFDKSNWDNAIPTEEYFTELRRVSANQIIWGGNYYPLPPTQCFIFWHKKNPVANFADGELAWTSFKKPAIYLDYRYYGGLQGNSSTGNKIHPTQKPIELYLELIRRFTNEIGGGYYS